MLLNFDSQLLSNEGAKEKLKVQTFSIAKSCLMSREASSLQNEFEKHFSCCICRVTFLMNENYQKKVSNNTFGYTKYNSQTSLVQNEN